MKRTFLIPCSDKNRKNGFVEHEVECEFTVKIDKDYDYRPEELFLDEIISCRFVHSGFCKTEEEVPKCADEIEKVYYKDILRYVVWRSYREIEMNKAIANSLYDYISNGDIPFTEAENYADYYGEF